MDPRWASQMQLAASLMIWAIVINILSVCLPRELGLKIFIDVVVALISWYAAWLVTMPEPGTPASQSWLSLRMSLRTLATVKIGGDVLRCFGTLIGVGPLEIAGLIIGAVWIPQLFIFLLYLRSLALRIPDPALAVNALIVMIGLPASVGLLLAVTAAIAIQYSGVAPTGASLGVLALVLLAGIGGSFVFMLWYIILLAWFKASFS
jgi:hypothetical protein